MTEEITSRRNLHSLLVTRPALATTGLLLLLTTAAAADTNDGYDIVYPILDDQTGLPIGYGETKSFTTQYHQGYLGCLQEHDLCNESEACYDDTLFGQCVSEDAILRGDLDLAFDWITPDHLQVINDKLKELAHNNFKWRDPYTQCVLKTTLDSLKVGMDDDSSVCRLTLDNLTKDNDELVDELKASLKTLEKELDEEENDNEGQGIEGNLHQLHNIKRNIKSNDDAVVTPYGQPSELDLDHDWWREFDTSLLQSEPKFSVKQQNDGGILIEPGQLSALEESYPNGEQFYVQPQDLEDGFYDRGIELSPEDLVYQDQVVWVNPEDSQEKTNHYFYFEDVPTEDDLDKEKLSRVRRHFDRHDLSDFEDQFILAENLRPTSDDRGSLELALPLTYPTPIDYNGEVELLSRHKFDTRPDIVNYQLLDQPETEFQTEFQPFREAPTDSERLVFSRNERLDVKKPGPYWPLSDRSYFLNKIVNADEQQGQGAPSEENEQNIMDEVSPFVSSTSQEDGATVGEVGQVEYEMPMLAPIKDKRVLNIYPNGFTSASLLNPDDKKDLDFVHMFLANRFDTESQGHDLIDKLAEEMGIPPQSLTDRHIDNQHVQFKVNTNPQNINAENMVNTIDQNVELRKRIGSEIGVSVEEVAPGTKDEYVRMGGPGRGNFLMNHLNLLVGLTSFLAAILAAVATIFLLKWRCRSRLNNNHHKLDPTDQLDMERGKVQEEYKQLCRDWSRCSKTQSNGDTVKNGDNDGSSPKNKKLQSQDSKNSDKSSTSSWGEEPTSTNMDISTGHMVLAYMEDHLKNKQRLEQEWVGLCSYEAEPCATAVAFKAENKKKNRYPDKLPYDHNRVILNAVLNASNSDYINASTVSDHDPRNPSYIVAQGPLAQTVADFWQMIWEQGCVVIVMLSRLQDNGYQLCHRYWPEEGSEQYHIFEVHLVSEHVWCDDYLVRSVYLKNTRTGETRTVTQFHFRSWPAQSVPASTKALLEFRRKVNKSYRGRSCPICIHCSDGVGRTGTYVLIDMVLNRMAKGCKEIDIAATLEHIRDQRSGMVQTRPQFEFSLMAVAEEVHAILKALLP